MSRLIFHIDVNNAYLSWEAAYRLQHGEGLDLRTIPAVIGGSEKNRHGIVLAKSNPAKKFNVKTGEPLYSARLKCPDIVTVPPRYNVYMKCSAALNEILQQYTPVIQRFSIDESFLDFSNMEHLYPDYMNLAETIRERIKRELGFTVNIGISSNKLLAKVASDFTKPDRIHTLFPEEIKEKMWPLPVEDLFMVGRATASKLHKLNINTIGELANYDINILKNTLKSHGELIWNYANGIDYSEVKINDHIDVKSIGNSTTTAFDVTDKETAHKILLSLCEKVSMRLRDSKNCCTVVSINLRGADFNFYSHQRKLTTATDSTKKLYEVVCSLFDEIWKRTPLRQLGVQGSGLCKNDFYQCSLLDDFDYEKDKKINKVIDEIRSKYGEQAIMRSCFIQSGVKSITGGVEEEDYPGMTSIL